MRERAVVTVMSEVASRYRLTACLTVNVEAVVYRRGAQYAAQRCSLIQLNASFKSFA